MTTLPDGRRIPSLTADEPTMLASWLDMHRATLAVKCSGLDDEQALRTSVEPSSLSLFGLVQHLAEVERNWIQRVFAQRDVPLLFPSSPGGGFTPDRGRTFAQVLALWESEVAVNREICAGRSLDETGRLGPEEAAVVGGDDVVSLRWVLVHLIEEYARHNGHADLLRERIDGVTGS
ncbi:DinB family protein [Streptomyces sp. NRRL S-920]|uniref:DinB family protein n=1 Tax=Streptomyces sp. NRRL S-920 TaxID=1463921 RepID=UPI0004C9D49A|nr:DinB family protein [Streptomyces sp. NRRL S-920]